MSLQVISQICALLQGAQHRSGKSRPKSRIQALGRSSTTEPPSRGGGWLTRQTGYTAILTLGCSSSPRAAGRLPRRHGRRKKKGWLTCPSRELLADTRCVSQVSGFRVCGRFSQCVEGQRSAGKIGTGM